ncbi:MAG: LysM peptidoglycan-binding domain-containing protein [Verrucomicrobiia bacterium]
MDTTLASQPVQAAACTLRRSLVVVMAGALLFFVACERSSSISDVEAEQEVNYQRAKRLCEQQDFSGAAEFYNKALLVNPEFATAHLEVGLLYENRLGDPISAIYHYRRFLELRPDSDKKQLVEDFIERAKLSLTAKLPQSPIVDTGELTRLESEKTALLQENAALRMRVAELEKTGNATPLVAIAPATVGEASASPPTPPAATAPAVAPGIVMAAAPMLSTPEAPPLESPRPRTYIVQRGDTLQSLALRYYGSRAAWERIFQANRSGLPSKDQLKVGQQLVIP